MVIKPTSLRPSIPLAKAQVPSAADSAGPITTALSVPARQHSSILFEEGCGENTSTVQTANIRLGIYPFTEVLFHSAASTLSSLCTRQ